MTRRIVKPKRFNDFVDGRIPAEYFESDFMLFEEYMISSGNTITSTDDKPHANSEFLLSKFKDFETFMKRESRRQAAADGVTFTV